MKTENHGPEPMQTDSGLYSEAQPPADEGPQRSTNAGDVNAKPVDPEAAALRNEAEQAKTRLCESLGLNPASTWQQVSEELETYVGNALALPNVEHQLEQAQASVDDLRDEVERLRGVIAEVEDQWCDAEDRQHDTFAARIESAIIRQYEARAAAESDLVDMAGQRDAAERRAEEAERRLRDAEGALLSTAKTIVGVADERLCWCGDCDDEYDEPTCAAARSVATDIRRALDAIDDAALPSQEQTPAPSGEHEVERLRARVRELEGRLAEALDHAACSLYFDERRKHGLSLWDVVHALDKATYDALAAGTWRPAGEAEAALPSQEQPAAPAEEWQTPPTCQRCRRWVKEPGVDWPAPFAYCECTDDAPPSTTEGETADTLGEPGPCGHEVTSPAPWCEECVRGGAPEGEQADDDADPSQWEPGDVVAFDPERVHWTLTERTSWPAWRMHWDGGQSWLPDDLAREQGWRRIRRSSEASTDERRG